MEKSVLGLPLAAIGFICAEPPAPAAFGKIIYLSYH